MAARNLNIRLAVDNTGQVVGEFRRIGEAGEKNLDRIRRKSGETSKQLEAASRQAAILRARFLALAAVAAAVATAMAFDRAVRDAANFAAAIGETADKLGIAADRLQEYRFAAASVDVSQQTLDLSLQRFIRRVGEAGAGTGELKGTLEQYGIAVRDSNGRMRESSDILADLAEATKGAGSQQEKLRIAVKAFDSEGAGMVKLLVQGADGMRALMEQAREMGAVLDEGVIKRAQEAQTVLTQLALVQETKVSAAMLNFLPILERLSARWVEFLEKSGHFMQLAEFLIEGFEDLGKRSDVRLQFDFDEIMVELQGLNEELAKTEGQLARFGSRGQTSTYFAERAARLRLDIAELEKQLAEINAEFDRRQRGADGRTQIEIGAPAESAQQRQAREKAATALARLRGELEPATEATQKLAEARKVLNEAFAQKVIDESELELLRGLAELEFTPPGQGYGPIELQVAQAAQAAAELEATRGEQLDARIRSMEREADLAGRTVREQEHLTDLTAAEAEIGRRLTAEEEARLRLARDLVTARTRERAALDQLESDVKALAQGTSGALRDAFRDGLEDGDFLTGFLDRMRTGLLDVAADFVEAMVIQPALGSLVQGVAPGVFGAGGSSPLNLIGAGSSVAQLFGAPSPLAGVGQKIMASIGLGGAATPAAAAGYLGAGETIVALGGGSAATGGLGAGLAAAAPIALPLAGIALAAGSGLFGKEKTPSAGARLGIANGRAFMKTTGVAGAGNLSGVMAEVEFAIDVLNSLADAGARLSLDGIPGDSVRLAVGEVAGNRDNTGAQIVRDLFRVGGIRGIDEGAVEAALTGRDIGEAMASAMREELAPALDEATSALALYTQGVTDASREASRAADRYRDVGQTLLAAASRLPIGDLSPLDPAARLTAARGLFTSQAASARQGDLEALSDLPSLADELLQASAAFHGATPLYAQDFDAVVAELEALGALSGTLASEADAQMTALSEQSDLLAGIRALLEAPEGPNADILRAQLQTLEAIATGDVSAVVAGVGTVADQAAAIVAERAAAAAGGGSNLVPMPTIGTAKDASAAVSRGAGGKVFTPDVLNTFGSIEAAVQNGYDVPLSLQFGGRAAANYLPGYAEGGITDGLSIAGEAGPEAVIPLSGGRRIGVARVPGIDGLRAEMAALRRQVQHLTDLTAEGVEESRRTSLATSRMAKRGR